MKVVAIIAEFNPPHLGHKHLVDMIRADLGEDTAIVAIMSGSYVQRGDLAICDPYLRAQMALSLGVNLVLELPFPYSMASAQQFAEAGVSIARRLGCVDYLAFGSECGDLNALARVALVADSAVFAQKIDEYRNGPVLRTQGYATLRERAIRDILGEDAAALVSQPNNILAIEYIGALRRQKSTVEPLTYPRVGGYHEQAPNPSEFPSASYIRRLISEQKYEKIENAVTEDAFRTLCSSLRDGAAPADISRVSSAILTGLYFRLSTLETAAECDASLARRIRDKLPDAKSYDHLIEMCKAKHYTDAHVRRAILFSYFGITPQDLVDAPAVTRLLACDTLGQALIKKVKSSGTLPYITKPADFPARLTGEALRQANRIFSADLLLSQALPQAGAWSDMLKKSPYIKK